MPINISRNRGHSTKNIYLNNILYYIYVYIYVHCIKYLHAQFCTQFNYMYTYMKYYQCILYTVYVFFLL